MANFSKDEFRYVRPIAAALIERAEFRQWFLADTKFATIAAESRHLPGLQASLRTTPASRKWYWFNVFCSDACSCQVEEWKPEDGRRIETDLFLVFKSALGTQFALHVEVKVPGDTFKKWQAETYPRRAACWAKKETRPGYIPEHSEFATILACGENLRGDTRRTYFDATIFHDDIEKRISHHPDRWDYRDPPPKAMTMEERRGWVGGWGVN